MKARIGVLGCLVLATVLLGGVAAAQQGDQGRAEKIRAILKAQDLRHGADTLFLRCLSDSDPVVRERATLACGSLQDSTLLPSLIENLVSGPAGVQEAAAFAIGQTGTAISRAGADTLASTILDGAIGRTLARGRMVEEVGKFGAAAHLLRLVAMARGDTGAVPDPFLMAIARFAIRSVTVPEATAYAVSALKNPRATTWRAAYALQRIGDNAGAGGFAAGLAPFLTHQDPLVRMNIATLFGKLKNDSTLVGPLATTASGDGDWRVRVNALKAIGNHRPDAQVASVFLAAIGDPDESVALTAIGAAGAYGSVDSTAAPLKGLVPSLRELASGTMKGKSWRHRTAAASALAKLTGPSALDDLVVPAGAEPLLAAGLLGAIGETGSPAAMTPIAAYMHSEDVLLRRTALEAAQALIAKNAANEELREHAYAANIAALGSGDMAVVTTAASNLGDSLLMRKSSVAPLAAALGRLTPPADIEAIQEVCRTLAKLGDSTAAPALRGVIASGDPPAVLAAAPALRTLTGWAPAAPEPALHTDFDFAMLESLPETVAVTLRTGKGDVAMEWYRDAAPFTIMSMLKLVRDRNFYRDLKFHRVVPNFVIQGGDPRSDGWGGPGYSVRSEFTPLRYEAGTIGIASAGKDTEGSQFFVTHSPQPHLEGRYTIIGKVVGGMDVVDRIQVGDAIVSVELAGR